MQQPLISSPSLETLVQELDPKKFARDDANSDKYSQDQTQLTEWELRAHTHVITNYVKETHNRVNEFIFKTHESLRNVDRTVLESNILGVSKNLEAKLDKEKTVFSDQLISVAKEKVGSEKSYRSFVLANGLMDRKAVYPESIMKFWGILIMILVCESILNSTFLSRGSELGMLGGFFTALIISIINLFAGTISGELVRNIYHRNLLRKVLGYLVPVISVVLAIMLALLVGHYRDALENDPFEAAVLAVPAFIQAPFGLANVNSWFLFGISVAAFFGAFWDRFISDDVYPNYGKLHREKVEKEAMFSDEKSEIYSRLSKIIQDSRAELIERHLEVKEKCEAYESGIRKSENLGKSYEAYLKQVNAIYISLVKDYRDDFSYVADYKLDIFDTDPLLNISEVSEIDKESIELDKQGLPVIQSLKGGLAGLFSQVEERIDQHTSDLNDTVERYISDIVKKAENTR